MKMDIGLSDKDRQGSIKILNTLLADEFMLYVKTLNYHWNVRGPSFFELHKFLNGQYDELAKIVDEVAERVPKLGGKAIGTFKEFSQHARLKEFPGEKLDSLKMIKNLLADHDALIVFLRKDLETCDEKLNDKGTCDFLTGLMEQHETMAWMLKSYLPED